MGLHIIFQIRKKEKATRCQTEISNREHRARVPEEGSEEQRGGLPVRHADNKIWLSVSMGTGALP